MTASASFQINDVKSVKNQWKEMLKLISRKLGNGTAALLSSAEPEKFREGLLTLRFPGNGQMAKQMCESNGKKEQLESIFSESAGDRVLLNFEVAKDAGENSGKAPAKTAGKLREEIIRHPAVKTIITELGATITGIEEDI